MLNIVIILFLELIITGLAIVNGFEENIDVYCFNIIENSIMREICNCIFETRSKNNILRTISYSHIKRVIQNSHLKKELFSHF